MKCSVGWIIWLDEIATMVENGNIVPVAGMVYSLGNSVEAY